MRIGFTLMILAGTLLAAKYDDVPYETWAKKQSNQMPGLERPRTPVIWDTYQYRALEEQRVAKRYWNYVTTLRNDDKNDIPGKVVNHFKGTWLLDDKGKECYYFKGDEVWVHYYSRVFPGVQLVFRDEAADGLVHLGEDQDAKLDGVGFWAADGFHEIEADWNADQKSYEFKIPDGRFARVNMNWYRQVFREIVRASVNPLGRWASFDEITAGKVDRVWATDVGINPRTGTDERNIPLTP